MTITHSAPRIFTSHSTALATMRWSVSGGNTMSVSQNHSQSHSVCWSKNSMTSRLRALARLPDASIAT